MMNWKEIWMTLFGTTEWLGLNIGFWVAMAVVVSIVIVMNVVFWSMKSRSDAKEPKTNRNYFLRSEAYEIENSCHGLFMLSQEHNKIRK